MAGKGPAPTKPSGSRRRPNATPGFTQLPFEGRHGEPPAWPLDGPTTDEANQWRKLWGLPQAVMWERMRCEDTVALYVRAYCLVISSADAKMLNEVRQLDSKLGLSPRALLDLRWEVELPPEDAEESAPSREHYRAAFIPDEV